MYDFVIAHWQEVVWQILLVATVPTFWWVGGKLFPDNHPNN